jgi:hypothetical protein
MVKELLAVRCEKDGLCRVSLVAARQRLERFAARQRLKHFAPGEVAGGPMHQELLLVPRV